MNRDQFEALVWEQLDGSIDGRDRARLEEYASRHPEALQWQKEQEALARRLDKVRDVAPPEVMRARIDEALRRATPPPARPVPVLERMRGWIASNLSGWSAVLRTETRTQGEWDPRGHGRYQAMSLKRNGVILAFAAVVVVAIVAIGYFSLHRPPAPAENATGATGAAQRYKAEQITEKDVRLDLQGADALDDAILAALTDEQKVDMLDRMDEGRRIKVFAAMNLDEAKWTGMDRRKKEALLGALSTDGVKALCAVAGVSQADFERRKIDKRVELADGMDAGRRAKWFAAINVDEAIYKGWDRRKKADYLAKMDADGRKAFRANVQFTEADFQAMSVDQRADMLDRMDAGRKQKFFGAINVDEAKYATMDRRKKVDWLGRLDADGVKAYCAAAQIDPADFERRKIDQRVDMLDRMDAGRKQKFFGAIAVDEAKYATMDRRKKADFLVKMDAAERADLFGQMSFERIALSRMDNMQQAAVWERMDGAARKATLGRLGVDETQFGKMNVQQKAELIGRANLDARRATGDGRGKGRD